MGVLVRCNSHMQGGSTSGVHGLSICYCVLTSQGVVSPMDVASVLQPPNRRLYMMLLATYGMMSNLDVGTEHLRWMGDTRFTLGALWVRLQLHPTAPPARLLLQGMSRVHAFVAGSSVACRVAQPESSY